MSQKPSDESDWVVLMPFQTFGSVFGPLWLVESLERGELKKGILRRGGCRWGTRCHGRWQRAKLSPRVGWPISVVCRTCTKVYS